MQPRACSHASASQLPCNRPRSSASHTEQLSEIAAGCGCQHFGPGEAANYAALGQQPLFGPDMTGDYMQISGQLDLHLHRAGRCGAHSKPLEHK